MGEGAGDALLGVGKALGDYHKTTQDQQYQADSMSARREQLDLSRKQFELQKIQAGIGNKLDFVKSIAGSYDPEAMAGALDRGGLNLQTILGNSPENQNPTADSPTWGQRLSPESTQPTQGTPLAAMFKGVPGGRAKQEAQSKMILDRGFALQGNQKSLEAGKLKDHEEKALKEADELLAQYRNIQTDISKGNTSSLPLGALTTFGGTAGERVVQHLSPDKAVAFKNLKQANALYQKFISGVAVAEPEARRLSTTQVQPTDSPEVQQKLIDNLAKKTREARLIAGANIADRMKQSGADYNLPDRKKVLLYQHIRESLNSDFQGSINNPKISAARRALGIDYGIE